MSKIIVFGAGGRVGRLVVAEALARGHQVTSVVRDPARHPDLPGQVVTGDVTDAASVAALVPGHDVAVSTVYDVSADPSAIYTAAAKALAAVPGVRVLVLGIAVLLESAPGVRLMDAPEFPAEYKPFCLGHLAGTQALAQTEGLDWLVLSPIGEFDFEAGRSGHRIDGGLVAPGWPRTEGALSGLDFVAAVVEEIETPRHHGKQVAVYPV
ncbi:NAD(P)-dependent oxidoreductase [Crossiella cryophila]|uniref:Putative NADH-flavin reductase n=1 Tax=Crossiella cryophila TaxID=43355 RepID=A0A7W7FVR4_9PSEU|nr:NAD(P)H-binding protein [Crossiella cryophila]MBB4679325.1 putative NADH-flavin reductase [Crossiella cryophila]